VAAPPEGDLRVRTAADVAAVHSNAGHIGATAAASANIPRAQIQFIEINDHRVAAIATRASQCAWTQECQSKLTKNAGCKLREAAMSGSRR